MMTSQEIAKLYQAACLDEIQALKPGNVHIFADGHRMVVQDFFKSAEVSAQPIAKENLSVGERIFEAVRSTHANVGMNTNLGIILLCTPLIQAAFRLNEANLSLQKNLQFVLENLTIDDANLTAKAIVLANPAGLKNTDQHDVHQTANVNLLEMMRYAEHQDNIAWQYTHHFENVFEDGLMAYQEAMALWDNHAWATTWVYLNFLCAIPDSHIVRKYGMELAQTVLTEAQEIKLKILNTGHPKLEKKCLISWDASLKARNINPGTSADLTVATLLAKKLM
jgi:triphosphoribosyl-dephospho-CoA synthase